MCRSASARPMCIPATRCWSTTVASSRSNADVPMRSSSVPASTRTPKTRCSTTLRAASAWSRRTTTSATPSAESASEPPDESSEVAMTVDMSRDDLSGHIFSGQDLSGAALSGKSLRNSHMVGTNLTGADLRISRARVWRRRN
ncbi:MAG: pentapeptide repeat-containing protein [Actinobacteria bacterium]|nr:MAG: pentapeptide repeat-containing protein [Actinomycetota bacterium]